MVAKKEDFCAITLRNHLNLYGFDDKYFGENIRGCMVTVVDNGLCYESALMPAEVKNRSKDRLIPVSRFLKPGDGLRFSGVMKFMIPPALKFKNFFEKPFVTPVVAMMLLIGKIKGLRNLEEVSYIEGWVSDGDNPPFSIFPFDKWVTVSSIEHTWFYFYSPDGRVWRISTAVLADPEHIEFCDALSSRTALD